jgi:3-deoxy-D-manno-octulosonate 8-phosphate phosphatase (KDO 8-P phosphatase)
MEALRPGLVPSLQKSQLTSRACSIKMVVTDWGGVLGDGDGHFSLTDGVAIERLRTEGIRTAIVTKARSTIVARRAEALASSHVFVGVQDKSAYLKMIADDAGLDFAAVACIAADESDLVLIRGIAEVGLTGAPQGAPEPLLDTVHFRCRRYAGYGAFREFADWICELRQLPS